MLLEENCLCCAPTGCGCNVNIARVTITGLNFCDCMPIAAADGYCVGSTPEHYFGEWRGTIDGNYDMEYAGENDFGECIYCYSGETTQFEWWRSSCTGDCGTDCVDCTMTNAYDGTLIMELNNTNSYNVNGSWDYLDIYVLHNGNVVDLIEAYEPDATCDDSINCSGTTMSPIGSYCVNGQLDDKYLWESAFANNVCFTGFVARFWPYSRVVGVGDNCSITVSGVTT